MQRSKNKAKLPTGRDRSSIRGFADVDMGSNSVYLRYLTRHSVEIVLWLSFPTARE